jgi:hypothetical protein
MAATTVWRPFKGWDGMIVEDILLVSYNSATSEHEPYARAAHKRAPPAERHLYTTAPPPPDVVKTRESILVLKQP